ncbi:hypothetical protein FKW77_001903 [Venturia effusa]|uniref:Uncharacterized protein n=1 Tax=Venturia effusa TaxID=50376 RepID=A0A517LMC2_9PEZI|nr:hypothetical protein FKW77_001903 [Venturia effusa]
MDPISFIGTLASAGTIVAAITKCAHTLARLRGRFQEADITLRLLLAELSAVKAALVQVEDWANYSASNSPVNENLASGFSDSLDGCQLAMNLLGEEVSRLAAGFGENEDDTRARMRTVWNDSSMKDHQQRLHGQIAALQLLLQAVHIRTISGQAQFLREPKSRQIIEQMKDDTSSLRVIARSSRTATSVLARTESTVGSTIFPFDQAMLNTRVYQANGREATERRRGHTVENSAASQRREEEEREYAGAPVSPRPSESVSSRTLAPTIRVQDTASSNYLQGEQWTRPRPYEVSVASEPVSSRPRHVMPLAALSESALLSSGMQVPHRTKSDEIKGGIFAGLRQKTSRLSLNFSSKGQLSPRSPVSPSAGLQRGRRRSENDINRSIDLNASHSVDAIPLIVRAAQEGSMREIEELLDQGAKIEQMTSATRRTALAVAAHCGNDDIVGVLLQRGASLSVVDFSGMTPLHLAASRGHYRVVEQLLHDRADIDCLTPDRKTPLRLASDEGYDEVAILLLHRDAKVNARDSQQLTALHAAAKAGDVGMVDILVANGADVEAKDAVFMAAIHYAARGGHNAILETLLKKKSNLECPGMASKTPLMFACEAGHKQTVELLLKRRASLKQKADGDMTALHWASYNGHAEIVELLLQKQRSLLEAKTRDGRTPLHVATLARSFATAEILIRKGAAIEAQCSVMTRPLHYACDSGELSTVQLLVSSGASIEAENLHGRRPMHIAALKGSREITQLLLAKAASIDVRDAVGERPLCLAAAHGHLGLVQLLLDSGAATRLKFRDGQSHEDSPLCLAAKYGHLSVVLELLSRGASVRQRDEQDWPPLRYAAFFGHPSVVEVLLEAGASISGISSGGWGFNLTAERIGFANTNITEERKQRVLELLQVAEARERSQVSTAASPPTTQAYIPQRDGVVEADDHVSVPEMPTRPPPDPNSVAAIAALASQVSRDRPAGFHFLAPALESGAPNPYLGAPSLHQPYPPPTSLEPTISPYQSIPFTSPSMPKSAPPAPPGRPTDSVSSQLSTTQAELDRLQTLICSSCRLAGSAVPDLTCAACRRAVFRFSYDQTPSEHLGPTAGNKRPVSYADGTGAFVHELGS